LPISGIDTDTRWGFSKSKGWVFGYKMHISCSTGYLVVSLSADYTTANISDNMSYRYLVVPIAGFVENVAADPPHMTTVSCTGLQMMHALQGLSIPSEDTRILHRRGLSLWNFTTRGKASAYTVPGRYQSSLSLSASRMRLAYLSCQFEDLRIQDHTC
jgi:hypothetical protein